MADDVVDLMYLDETSFMDLSILVGTLESINYLTSMHYRAPQLGVSATGVLGKFSTR